jgi:YebC/PmpR family DNA-binding regulatory protein
MSGHNKWSKIKHKKGLNDAGRGQLFTKLGNSITIAVREGGGADPDSNVRLRLAIEKARQANMPKENIQRGIDRALGKLGGTVPETVVYEGFAPGGVGVLVEVLTDNRQRSAAEIKNMFSIHQGNLGGAGSVSYLFEKVGQLTLKKDRSLDDLGMIILTTAATDFVEEDEDLIVYTQVSDLHAVEEDLKKAGLGVSESLIMYKPTTQITIENSTLEAKIVRLLESLDDSADVQNVYANAVFSHI